MSDQGGKKGKGRGRKRGKGRGGQQQRQNESVPGRQQQQRDEQQGATALPEQRQQPQQGRQQSQKQPQRKRQPSDEQQGATALPEQRQPPKETQQQPQQGGQRSQKQPQRKQQPSDEQQGATALPEQRQLPKETQQQPQQGRQQSKKQPQRKQHPSDEQEEAMAQRQPPKETQQQPQQGQQQSQKQPQRKQQPGDRTDGAGPSKPQGQPSPASQGDPRPQDPSQPRAQPSTQPQPSTGATKPAPPQQPQSPRGAEKPDPSGQRGGTPQSDRAVPKPPRRPDGGGRSGRPIQLRANFLPVKIPTGDVHHYDTDIREKGKKSEEGYTRAEAPKIIQEVVKIYEKENPSGPKLVYDKSGKNMYCRRLIPGIGKDSRRYNLQYTTDNGREKEFIVDVKHAAVVSLYYLNEALEGRHTEIPFDIMQAIQTALQQMPKMKTIQVRNSFFDYPTGREKDLGGGIQVWNGTFVSIRPTQWKMMLNVDTCATGFYKGQSVLDFMCEFLNQRNLPRRLDERQRKKFAKEIKAIKVETTHIKRKQKASGLSFKSAKDETFDCEGRKVSVLNYFKDKYNITLQHPDLPCIKIGQKGNLIPIELCRVVDGQKKQGKLTGAQTQQMIRHTAIPAPDRLQKITELIRKLHYESDPYSRDFGISIGNEMVTIQGRVLDPPLLMYGPGNRPGKEMPRDGSWKITKKMLDPKELKEWALISYINDSQPKRGGGGGRYRGPEYLDDRGVDDLIHYLVDVGREKGVRVNENPCYVGKETGFHGTDKLFSNLKARYPNLQLIVVVLPVNGDDYYEEVKHCGDVVYGITTQCIKVEQASSDFSDWRKRETLVNLWLKINAKLGGTTCALDKTVKSPILQRPVIIFGADVTHPAAGDKSNPSIAAVVASKDSYPTLYNAEVRVQTHRQEMIADLKEMVKILLKKFRASTGAIPGKIIFYRDGVSEGQFRDVLMNELSAIQRACRELKDDYTPAITFIVVQKRHHARFFAVDPKDQRGKSRNIPAGTVVDTQICHPFEFNWYLCSHAGIQGTSKPALYHVLYDDSNFKSDDLQILTNQLCYTYVRCARSVSIPAPAYYAHHVAFRARHHLKIESSTEGST
ncbi:argonaute-2-like isoform X2, partial [Paramuricea clavata]